MVLKLYGYPSSTCTLQHKSPEYLEKQPFGQIPYIDDDGFVLAKYADKGPKLTPDVSDLKAYALYEQAASVESFNFDALASKAVYENVFKNVLLFRRRGGVPDAQIFNSLIEALDAKLKAFEVILGKQKYLAGDEITLADLFHLPYGSMLSVAGSDIMSKQGPNVTRWWNDLTSRPAWKAVVQGIPEKPTF
ncbi:glutathione s-transferase [Moniliophthora roreri]|nr:glutathione s-transferase [Moniliophthora roreri]